MVLRKIKSFVPGVFLILFLVLIGSVVAIFSIQEKKFENTEYEQYIVIFPFSYDTLDAFQTIVQSGGLLVRFGLFDNIAVTATKEKEHKQRLYQSGALWVFRPPFKGGCAFETIVPAQAPRLFTN